MQAVENRMPKISGPVKRTAYLKNLASYLRETQKDSMHFILASYATKRSSILSFATINFGEHPLLGVNEDGVCINQHTVTCRRDGRGGTLINQSLGYISRHAVQRLHERGHSLTIDTATKMFRCVGMLGCLMGYSDRHIDGGLCIHIEDMMAVGVVRHAVGMPEQAKESSCVFYEVRTFLPVEELIDNGNRRLMMEQGGASMDALHEWVKSGRDDVASKAILEKIPTMAWDDGADFVLQNAIKTRVEVA